MCALCSAAAGEVNPGTITGETGKVMCEAGVYRRRSNTFNKMADLEKVTISLSDLIVPVLLQLC